MSFWGQVLHGLVPYLGICSAILFWFGVAVLVDTVKEIRHKLWLQTCPYCGHRRNTYDAGLCIPYICREHGNYLANHPKYGKMRFGQ